MAVETEEVVSEEQETEELSAFDQAVDDVKYVTPDEPDEDEVEEEAQDDGVDESAEDESVDDGQEEQEEEKPETDEGPSIAMQAVARQSNIPEEFIKLARDDKQLQEIIALANREDEGALPVEETEEFDLELPEEEFDADDPVRKQFEKLNSHYKSEINSLKSVLRDATQVIEGLAVSKKQTDEERAFDALNRFDSSLSNEKNDFLGNGDLNESHVAVRTLIWNKTQEKIASGSKKPIEELAKTTARELFPAFFNGNTTQAARRQSKKRLGAGASKPVEPVLGKKDSLFSKWDKILGG